LCNNNKKPTGKSTPDKFVSEAQKIYSRILENESADNYGDKDSNECDDEDNRASEEDDEDSSKEEFIEDLTPCKEINFVDVEEVKTQSSKLNFKNDHVSVKTKNSKPQESNPRNNAGKAISKLVDSIADSQKSSNSDLILFLNSQERFRELEGAKSREG
jgi:hypothetical protein